MADAYAYPELIVDTAWLQEHLDDPGVRVVDLRLKDRYQQSHLPGAVSFTRDDLRTKQGPLFLLSPSEFERAMGEAGISNQTKVVAYDDRGQMDPAWMWWMLKYFGHDNVALVDGGWQKWTAESRPTTQEPARPPKATFRADVQAKWIVTADEVKALIGRPGVKIIDGRSQQEFDGVLDQTWRPYYGERHGRVPSALHVFWEELVDPSAHKAFRPVAQMRRFFESKGLKPEDRIISYCLGGMRSSVNLFGLYQAGYRNVALYHGSWWDWGERSDLPMVSLSNPGK